MPVLRAFQPQGRQPASRIRAGIDADSVRAGFDRFGNRVAVHHHLIQRGSVIEKRVANPPQVAAALLIEWRIGADARVDERIVPDHHHVLEPVEERAVGSRNEVRESMDQLLVIEPLIFAGGHAVAQHRFAPADSAEQPQRLRLAVERAEKDLLMVAQQEADARMRIGQRDQPVEDAGRIGAAVDEVAEEDDARLGGADSAGVLDRPWMSPIA